MGTSVRNTRLIQRELSLAAQVRFQLILREEIRVPADRRRELHVRVDAQARVRARRGALRRTAHRRADRELAGQTGRERVDDVAVARVVPRRRLSPVGKWDALLGAERPREIASEDHHLAHEQPRSRVRVLSREFHAHGVAFHGSDRVRGAFAGVAAFFAAVEIAVEIVLVLGQKPEGRSIQANVGVELKGVSWS